MNPFNTECTFQNYHKQLKGIDLEYCYSKHEWTLPTQQPNSSILLFVYAAFLAQRAQYLKYRKTAPALESSTLGKASTQNTGANREQCTLCKEDTATALTQPRDLVSARERTWRTVTREVLSSKDWHINTETGRSKGQRPRKAFPATGIAGKGCERCISNREKKRSWIQRLKTWNWLKKRQTV